MEKNNLILNDDLVSVVIPAYNASNYLKYSIESVLNQSYSNIELIVVNDGSNDNNATDLIAKSYGNKIKYYYQENSGVSVALNTGIKNSNGKWIAWLSHDDVFESNKIEKQLLHLKNHPEYDVSYCDYNVIDEFGNLQGCINLPSYDSKDFTIHLIQAMFVCGSTILMKKKCFESIGFFDEKLRYSQDADFWIRLSTKHKFLHSKEKLLNWRFHESQGSRNFTAMKNDRRNYLLNIINKISLYDIFEDQNRVKNFESRAQNKLAIIFLKCHREVDLSIILFKQSVAKWKSIRNPAHYYLIYLNYFGKYFYSFATQLAFIIRKTSRKNIKVPIVDFFHASNIVNINL